MTESPCHLSGSSQAEYCLTHRAMEVSVLSKPSNIKWKWYMWDQAGASPEATGKFCEEVAQMWWPLLLPLPCLHQHMHVSSREFPKISRHRERKLQPGLQVAVHTMQAPPERGELQHWAPFWDIPERKWWKEILTVWRTSSSTPSFLLRRRDSQTSNSVDGGSWSWKQHN